MAAVDPNTLSKFVGILEVAPQATPGVLTRVASVRGMVSNFDNSVNAVNVKADDTGSVFKGFTPEVRFEGTFLENADRDLIKLLVGGTSADVAGAPVSITTEALGTGWTVGQPIKLANKNGDDTVVTSIVIDAGGAPLVLNTDYNVYVGDGTNGDVGFTYITPITVQAGVLDADYDYTPNTREDLTFPVTFTESPRLYSKITATDPATGNTRVFILDDSTFEGVYGLEVLDVVEAGDLTGTAFVIKANEGSNFIYQNEIL